MGTRTMATFSQDKSLLHWANLLYGLIAIASLPIMQGATNKPPPPWLNPAVGMIVAQIFLLLIPALLFVKLTRKPFQEIFKLKRLPFASGVKCFLIGLFGWSTATFLGLLGQNLVNLINPTPISAAPSLSSGGLTPWIFFLGIGLVAPLCEEVLCRGVLLSVYEKQFGIHAVWLVGILFTILHMRIEDLLGALFVGIVAGWVVYRTRSLWAGVLVHMGNNLLPALIMLLISLLLPNGAETAAKVSDASSLWEAMLVWAGIGLIMMIPWFFLIRIIAKHYPQPECQKAGFRLKTLWSFAILMIGAVAYFTYVLASR
jgi:uncharacterized protein